MHPESPYPAQSPGCVVVAGMHRSGTSLVAGLLTQLGVEMGSRLVPADVANPLGYFEDLDIVELHQRVFRERLPQGNGGHPDWGWTPTDVIQPEDMAAWLPTAERVVERRAATSEVWGFKDPRTTLLLDCWDAVLPSPVYIAVYRQPSRVADSMQRLGAPVFLKNPGYAWPLWTLYNRRLLAFVRRHRSRCVLMNVDALQANLEHLPVLLRNRLGLALRTTDLRAHFDPALLHPQEDALLRAQLSHHVWDAAGALYDELESIADLPAADAGYRRTTPFPVPCPASSCELSIVIPTYNDATWLVEAIASAWHCADGCHEVLVLDDGTTDPESLRILERLRATGQAVIRQRECRAAERTQCPHLAGARGVHIAVRCRQSAEPSVHSTGPCGVPRRTARWVVYGDRELFGAQRERIAVPKFNLRQMVSQKHIDACAMFRQGSVARCRRLRSTPAIRLRRLGILAECRQAWLDVQAPAPNRA